MNSERGEATIIGILALLALVGGIFAGTLGVTQKEPFKTTPQASTNYYDITVEDTISYDSSKKQFTLTVGNVCRRSTLTSGVNDVKLYLMGSSQYVQDPALPHLILNFNYPSGTNKCASQHGQAPKSVIIKMNDAWTTANPVCPAITDLTLRVTVNGGRDTEQTLTLPAQTSQCEAAPTGNPDLTINSLTVNQTNGASGANLQLTITTKNIGNKPAPTMSNTIVQITKQGAAYPLWSPNYSIAALSAGAEDTRTLTDALINNLEPGTYHIAARADVDNLIPESNENNNVRETDAIINPPDQPGQPSCSLSASVDAQGRIAATGSRQNNANWVELGIYNKTESRWTSFGTAIPTCSGSSCPVSQTSGPMLAGEYQVICNAGDNNNRSDANYKCTGFNVSSLSDWPNDCGSGARKDLTVGGVGRADLSLEMTTQKPQDPEINDQFIVNSITVKNQSDVDYAGVGSSSFDLVGFALDPDNTQTEIFRQTFTGLAARAQETIAASRLPSINLVKNGAYTVRFQVNSNCAAGANETSCDNNTVSDSLTVGPACQAPSLGPVPEVGATGPGGGSGQDQCKFSDPCYKDGMNCPAPQAAGYPTWGHFGIDRIAEDSGSAQDRDFQYRYRLYANGQELSSQEVARGGGDNRLIFTNVRASDVCNQAYEYYATVEKICANGSISSPVAGDTVTAGGGGAGTIGCCSDRAATPTPGNQPGDQTGTITGTVTVNGLENPHGPIVVLAASFLNSGGEQFVYNEEGDLTSRLPSSGTGTTTYTIEHDSLRSPRYEDIHAQIGPQADRKYINSDTQTCSKVPCDNINFTITIPADSGGECLVGNCTQISQNWLDKTIYRKTTADGQSNFYSSSSCPDISLIQDLDAYCTDSTPSTPTPTTTPTPILPPPSIPLPPSIWPASGTAAGILTINNPGRSNFFPYLEMEVFQATNPSNSWKQRVQDGLTIDAGANRYNFGIAGIQVPDANEEFVLRVIIGRDLLAPMVKDVETFRFYAHTASRTLYPSITVTGSGIQSIVEANLTGDFNFDKKVNSLDYSSLISKYGPAPENTLQDINADGAVNTIDVSILYSSWSQ